MSMNMAGNGEGMAIGIDLGTTYSRVEVWQKQQNRVEIIFNDQGNRTTPSYVAFTDTQRLIVIAAKNQAVSNATNSLRTEQTNQMTISNDKQRLSKAEIERMIREGERFNAEDEDYKKRVQAKNAMESYANELSDALEDEGISSKISNDEKKKIEDAIEESTVWLDGNQLAEVDEFEFKMEELGGICKSITVNLCQSWAEAGTHADNEKHSWMLKLAK